MERGHAPVKAPSGRFVGAGQRRADHDRVGAQGDRLGDVAAVAHPAVGDHLAVLARLEHVRRASVSHVGDRGRLRYADAEHAAGGTSCARSDADEHAGRAGAHQVKTRLVGGATANHYRHVERRDELLEVQGLGDRGHVFPGYDCALDHEHVQAGLQGDLVVGENSLRGERSRTTTFCSLISRIRWAINSGMTGWA